MSSCTPRSRDLLTAYDVSLEQQIVGRGSSLACRDEQLWKRAEEALRDGDAQEIHCLGLDPLDVMEESLRAAATAAPMVHGGKGRSRGGRLEGLAKAFEVLEQAALNLYLSPWREEYKVVKMYSGPFTHHIKPVLSTPQIDLLFGLLGYRSSPSQQEQVLGVAPSSLDDFLRLSCAFYLARCECRLLRAALGTYGDDAQCELRAVRERQRGHSVQVAVDNGKKMLKVTPPVMEPYYEEVDVDLYTDEHVNGEQPGALVADDGDDRTWKTRAPPPAVQTRSDEPPPSSNVSVHNSQVTATDILRRQRRRPSRRGEAEPGSEPGSLQVAPVALPREVETLCSCIQSPDLYLQRCSECNALHDVMCAVLDRCRVENHLVVSASDGASATEGVGRSVSMLAPTLTGSSSASMTSLALRDIATSRMSPTLSSSTAAMSSLAMHDSPDSKSATAASPPITYHDCCDVTQLDPQYFCPGCNVFHTEYCKGLSFCRQMSHLVQPLGFCACGKQCSRNPLVLCRYCGRETCKTCWFRNVLTCGHCGQILNQSSPV